MFLERRERRVSECHDISSQDTFPTTSVRLWRMDNQTRSQRFVWFLCSIPPFKVTIVIWGVVVVAQLVEKSLMTLGVRVRIRSSQKLYLTFYWIDYNTKRDQEWPILIKENFIHWFRNMPLWMGWSESSLHSIKNL